MSTKKDSGSIGLASYLSPADLRKAVRLTSDIKSAKRVEDVLKYQKQLAFLMARAERNKKHQERMMRRRERMIRDQALQMKKLDKQQIKERYSGLRVEPVEPVESVGMVVVGKDFVDQVPRRKGSGRHYILRENAVEGAKSQATLPKRFTIKSHSGSEKNG